MANYACGITFGLFVLLVVRSALTASVLSAAPSGAHCTTDQECTGGLWCLPSGISGSGASQFKCQLVAPTFLGTSECDGTTGMLVSFPRTCQQVFGNGSTCVQGKCSCSIPYNPNPGNNGCQYIGAIGSNCTQCTGLVTGTLRTCAEVFGNGSTCCRGQCLCKEPSSPNLDNTACQPGVPDCNTTFTGPAGEITSPGYPCNYDDRTFCYYRITVTTGQQIYDGSNNSTTMLATLTGRTLPAVTIYTSSSNVMYLQFTADFSIVYSGFRLQYSEV